MRAASALFLLASTAGQQMVAPGGMTPYSGGGGGGGPRFGGYVRLSEPVLGFFVTGSSIDPMNGVFGPRLDSAAATSALPPSLASTVGHGAYPHSHSGWTLAHVKKPGGRDHEWVLFDANFRERFACPGDSLIPSSGRRWSHLHRVSRVPPSEAEAAAEKKTGGTEGGGGGGGGAAAGGGASGSWRIKFLYKVGVADGGGGPAGSPTGTPVGSPQPGRREDMPFDTASSAAAPDAVSLPVVASSRESEADREGGEVVLVRQRMVKARSSSDIRKGYIAKLRESEKLLPQLTRPREAQTVTIFDWDDTLLCTTHLEMMQRQQGSLPPQVREQLAALEAIVSQLLTAASANGKVFIITNASEGWVQHSSSMCFPNLQPLLASVVIISARAGSETQPPSGSLHSSLSLSLSSQLSAHRFETQYPGDSHAWKMHAFLKVQDQLQLEAVTNLVSVGDSHIEMDAVHLLGRSFAHALVKTVKLWERPTPYELQKQLEVVADKLPDIYTSGTTLNIWLERESAPPLPPPPSEEGAFMEMGP